MERDDLIDLLLELIAAGILTLLQSREALRLFDAGELIVSVPDIDITAINPSFDQGKVDAIQDAFDTRVTQIATLAPAAWADAFVSIVAEYLAAQWIAGGGRNVGNLVALWEAQQPYIRRFVATVVIRQAVATPMTPKAITQRAMLYGGAGRALHYQEKESDLAGFVCDYVSRDDASTCRPCLEAERNGPYLPQTGPMPGAVCLGRGKCRCRRVERYDPHEAARLRGI